MTERERWLATFHYQPVDHVVDCEFGYWTEVYETWQAQGMPADITDEGRANRYFGFERRGGVPAHLGLIPAFEPRVVEETDRYRIHLDGEGVTSIVHKDGRSSIPHYLRFPIEDRADWELFRERLDPATPGRTLDDRRWTEFKARAAERDYPLGIHCGSLFGKLRDWMGFENIAIACATEPLWVEEMMEHLTELTLVVIDRAVRELDLDYATFWEDMCFNKGPIISPAMFRRWMTPRYRRITDFLREHGVDIVYVDSDGNIIDLVEHWLAGGVNVMFPCEVRGGSDPVEIRRRFGREALLMGGVDKTRLIAGRAAIDAELDRLEPLVAEGGFIPHVDHRCPPDVAYADYLYYLEQKRRRFGIPDPPNWDQVRGTAELVGA